LENVFEKVGR